MLKTMALEKLHFFIDNFYNIMDVVMLSLYITSFTLRYFTVIKASVKVLFSPHTRRE